MKKTRIIKRRTYKANERRERMRIYELYDGPATDTSAAVRHMDQIHQWIKCGKLPALSEAPPKNLKLIDKNP